MTTATSHLLPLGLLFGVEDRLNLARGVLPDVTHSALALLLGACAGMSDYSSSSNSGLRAASFHSSAVKCSLEEALKAARAFSILSFRVSGINCWRFNASSREAGFGADVNGSVMCVVSAITFTF
jgi:hypothetical protein